MAGAHIGETPAFDPFDPSTWTDLVHGRSSILFAVLAGISIALMTGRSTLPGSRAHADDPSAARRPRRRDLRDRSRRSRC